MIKLRRKKQRFFTTKEEETIILAIRHAERQTSGEIRVHIQHKLEKEVLVEATMAFHRLKMDRTEERNGVIFFLCPSQKQFAIFGDEGINKKVSDGFWDDVKEILCGDCFAWEFYRDEIKNQTPKLNFGRGWHLRKRFEAPDGKIYSFGKETGEKHVRNSK